MRDQLIAAAETLFAQRGVDAVSLREINATAGARNASALHYHFRDRAGLIRAVLDKHDAEVEARRHALLDQYEANGVADVRTLTAALVRPLAAELEVDGGSGYLQVMADLHNRPQPPIDPATLDDRTKSGYRWRTLIEPYLDPQAIRQHRRLLAVRFTLNELARRARNPDRSDHRLFISDLIDATTGLLTANLSDETRNAGKSRSTGH